MTAYCTSKYAITGLTETLRLELEPSGIHVSGIHPSVTNSDFLERAVFKESDPQQMKQLLSSPFASQPSDVAQAILDAVKHSQAEVIVGSAKVPTFLHRLFPNLTQGLWQLANKAR